ncbi:carboxypeptidase regulatory-like domain-containing protein [Silvibacterium acidisoli]|uniref:carboxypeptidase regulatory-like domain-containing protein n=1 Tax=Acidobacteriaceae bacterium ZG23-2 TaxID=2883246 RepID=UPI00406CA295
MSVATLSFKAPNVFAQVDQGSITGVVTDTTGAVIPNASLTLVNTDTNFTLVRKSGGSGDYVFSPIKIGNYSLTVVADGFQKIVRENIHVSVSQTVGVNLSLQPGAASETVTVTSAPELQTEQASTGQVFDTKQINDIPLNGRDYVFAAQLTTGVAAPNQGFRQVAGAGDFTSNGGRVSENNFILDGVDNNSNMQDFLNGATYAVRPPPDALAEFSVESSNYSAELGRSTGAAVNASIKSGTNQFHGSLWEYYRSDRMAALDYFSTQSNAYHMNQFGATLGGPVWKNKIFFFADSQASRISNFVPPQANYTVPTAAERTGDFTQLLNVANLNGVSDNPIHLNLPGGTPTNSDGSAIPGSTPRYLACNGVQNVVCAPNLIAEKILNLYPLPNQGVAGSVYHNYTVPATATTNNTVQYDIRVDYNFSQSDQMFGRYSYSNNPTTYTPPLGILDGGGYGADGTNQNYGKSGVFSETHFFSPTLSNEFRLGFNWLFAAALQPGSNTNVAAEYGMGGIPSGPSLGGFPAMSFQGSPTQGAGLSSVGVPGYEPSSEKQNVAELIDNVSKVLGNHTIKTGINFQHIRFYGLQPPNGIGSQNYTGQYTADPSMPNVITGWGAADFLLDDMNSSSLNTVTPFTDLRYYWSAFVQDDWKVTPRLTLNLGLRWEYSQPFRELNNHQANFFGTYAGMNQGTGTYLIPAAQENYPIAPALLATLAADHINIQYTNNNYLVNPHRLNFAPRIGLSYMVDPRTVLRAGGGIFYGGQENVGLGLNLANNAPFFVNASFVPNPDECNNISGTVTCPTNGQTLETGFGAAANDPNALANAAGVGAIYAQDQDDKTALTTAYNLTAQHAITNTLSFTLGYQGNVSRHLRASYSANTYPGFIPVSVSNSQNYQPFHDFSITNVTNGGIARYDSLQAKIEKKYSNGLYLLAGYTWAHCLDDAFGPIGQSAYGGYRNPNLLGIRYDYGNCTQDVRNRFTINAEYELPFGKGKMFANKGGMTNAVVGGWKVNGVFQAQSGDPIFLNSSNQGGSYPIKIGDPFGKGSMLSAAQQQVLQPGFNCATKTKTLQQWFNPCAFINPPQVTLGATDPSQNLINVNSAGLQPAGPKGRVEVPGPGFNQLDMSLFKTFPIKFHSSALELRADGFNVLNHPTFSNPGNSLTSSQGQAVTATRFSAIIPDARVIQVAAHLVF